MDEETVSQSPVKETGTPASDREKSPKSREISAKTKEPLAKNNDQWGLSKMTRIVYTKDELVALRHHPISKERPSYMDDDFFTGDGLYNMEAWHSQLVHRNSEYGQNTIKQVELNKEKDAEKTRSKRDTSGDAIALRPQALSMKFGCSAKNTARRQSEADAPDSGRERERLGGSEQRSSGRNQPNRQLSISFVKTNGKVIKKLQEDEGEERGGARDSWTARYQTPPSSSGYRRGEGESSFRRSDSDSGFRRHDHDRWERGAGYDHGGGRYGRNGRQQHRYREEEMPEWLDSGPTSVHDTIELMGMPEDETFEERESEMHRRSRGRDDTLMAGSGRLLSGAHLPEMSETMAAAPTPPEPKVEERITAAAAFTADTVTQDRAPAPTIQPAASVNIPGFDLPVVEIPEDKNMAFESRFRKMMSDAGSFGQPEDPFTRQRPDAARQTVAEDESFVTSILGGILGNSNERRTPSPKIIAPSALESGSTVVDPSSRVSHAVGGPTSDPTAHIKSLLGISMSQQQPAQPKAGPLPETPLRGRGVVKTLAEIEAGLRPQETKQDKGVENQLVQNLFAAVAKQQQQPQQQQQADNLQQVAATAQAMQQMRLVQLQEAERIKQQQLQQQREREQQQRDREAAGQPPNVNAAAAAVLQQWSHLPVEAVIAASQQQIKKLQQVIEALLGRQAQISQANATAHQTMSGAHLMQTLQNLQNHNQAVQANLAQQRIGLQTMTMVYNHVLQQEQQQQLPSLAGSRDNISSPVALGQQPPSSVATPTAVHATPTRGMSQPQGSPGRALTRTPDRPASGSAQSGVSTAFTPTAVMRNMIKQEDLRQHRPGSDSPSGDGRRVMPGNAGGLPDVSATSRPIRGGQQQAAEVLQNGLVAPQQRPIVGGLQAGGGMPLRPPAPPAAQQGHAQPQATPPMTQAVAAQHLAVYQAMVQQLQRHHGGQLPHNVTAYLQLQQQRLMQMLAQQQGQQQQMAATSDNTSPLSGGPPHVASQGSPGAPGGPQAPQYQVPLQVSPPQPLKPAARPSVSAGGDGGAFGGLSVDQLFKMSSTMSNQTLPSVPRTQARTVDELENMSAP